jgi:hypothetical protein
LAYQKIGHLVPPQMKRSPAGNAGLAPSLTLSGPASESQT